MILGKIKTYKIIQQAYKMGKKKVKIQELELF